MLPFNPGVSYLATNLGIPVIPAYIANSNKRFLRLVLRSDRLKISFGAPISPVGYGNKREDMERFSQKLKEEVLKLR
jgi:1-acyl-sn-glycerol-3-phosphate acyltransferase